MDLSMGMQGWFSIWKLVNAIHHYQQTEKGKKWSIEAEKTDYQKAQIVRMDSKNKIQLNTVYKRYTLHLKLWK